jgi:hypothetical protein
MVSSFLVVISAAASMVWARSELPGAQHAGPLTDVPGGNTPAQQQATQNDAMRYPLEVRFLWGRGAKETPVNAYRWSIRTATGHVAAMGSSSGPIVLASVRDGRYTVQATYHDVTVTRPVQVRRGVHKYVLLEWPQ